MVVKLQWDIVRLIFIHNFSNKLLSCHPYLHNTSCYLPFIPSWSLFDTYICSLHHRIGLKCLAHFANCLRVHISRLRKLCVRMEEGNSSIYSFWVISCNGVSVSLYQRACSLKSTYNLPWNCQWSKVSQLS